MPFNSQRSGMILGSGGIGIMLESEEGARRRFHTEVNRSLAKSSDDSAVPMTIKRKQPFCCRLLGTYNYVNCAALAVYLLTAVLT